VPPWGKDALGKALGAEAAVGFLGNLEYDLIHNFETGRLRGFEQVQTTL
jgi:hypothetical protein